ncbi:hypothetical protein ACZ90_66075 [Streptomyces albus subsp. albus]|nr:hypothetical protein ACZ90_66075 [Streptomyces albus subsp. albus]
MGTSIDETPLTPEPHDPGDSAGREARGSRDTGERAEEIDDIEHGAAEADETPARRRRPLAIASVAAAVLLAGGGGALWAARAGGGGTAQAGAPEPLALDGYRGAGTRSAEGIAVGEPDPHGTRYRADGKLPGGPESAPAYLTGATVTRAEVARLAKALDVAGTPRSDHGVWRVGGAPDAMSPTLQVSRTGPGGWSYSRYGSPGGTTCVHPAEPASSADDPASTADGTTASGTAPATAGPSDGRPRGCGSFRDGPDTTSSTGAVSEQRAKRAAAPVLRELGLTGARLDAGQRLGATRMVTADPVVGGLPTYGWQTNLQIGADGQLVGGSGMLARPTPTADYPLISAGEALKQLNGAGGPAPLPKGTTLCATPVPASPARPDHGSGAGDAASAAPATADAGTVASADGDGPKGRQGAPCLSGQPSARDGAPETVRVRKAVFGLAAHSVDGRQALVPSWIFELRHRGPGETVVVRPAVDPKYIRWTATGDARQQTPADPAEPAKPTEPAEPAEPAEPGQPVRTGPDDEPVDDYDYADSGKTLTLYFSGGICTRYTASAQESDDRVTVRISGRREHPGQPCPAMATGYHREITLDRPLGDRKVVDAVRGDQVPQHARQK